MGFEDRVVTLSFFPDSESYKLYGNHLTIVFQYSKKERLELDFDFSLYFKNYTLLKISFVKSIFTGK